MATFEYNAVTSAGRLMKGTIESGTPAEASEALAQMQLTVHSIEKAKPERLKTAIGRNEFMLFNQQLASITKAGIPLEKGLRELCLDRRWEMLCLVPRHSLFSSMRFASTRIERAKERGRPTEKPIVSMFVPSFEPPP